MEMLAHRGLASRSDRHYFTPYHISLREQRCEERTHQSDGQQSNLDRLIPRLITPFHTPDIRTETPILRKKPETKLPFQKPLD
jgi:hypothetical protein